MCDDLFLPRPKRPVLCTSVAPWYPSILQTTSPSFLSQASSHTVPHRRSWKTSTRPSWGPDPFTSRTRVSSTVTHKQIIIIMCKHKLPDRQTRHWCVYTEFPGDNITLRPALHVIHANVCMVLDIKPNQHEKMQRECYECHQIRFDMYSDAGRVAYTVYLTDMREVWDYNPKLRYSMNISPNI